MTESSRIERNRSELQTCHPVFRAKLAMLLAVMQAAGYRPRIQVAWRSPDDQLVAFRTGHSHVTWGFHNATAPDGTPEALAADVLDDDHPLAPSRPFLIVMAREARALGLDTGIDWDLPSNVRLALNAAIEKGAMWEGKIGFDPTHVEISGLTVAQAHAGLRPGQSDSGVRTARADSESGGNRPAGT